MTCLKGRNDIGEGRSSNLACDVASLLVGKHDPDFDLNGASSQHTDEPTTSFLSQSTRCSRLLETLKRCPLVAQMGFAMRRATSQAVKGHSVLAGVHRETLLSKCDLQEVKLLKDGFNLELNLCCLFNLQKNRPV